jgi:hypothetical protein
MIASTDIAWVPHDDVHTHSEKIVDAWIILSEYLNAAYICIASFII